MKKRIMSLVSLAVLSAILILALAACGGGGDVLKGTWDGSSEDQKVSWQFDGKGGCEMETEYGWKDKGDYKIEGDKVTIDLSAWEEPIEYNFTIEGKNLSLSSDNPYKPSYELTKK